MKAFILDSEGQIQKEIKNIPIKVYVGLFRSEKSIEYGVSKKCDKSYLGITQNVLILQIILEIFFEKFVQSYNAAVKLIHIAFFM